MAWWTIDAARDLSSRVAGAAAWVTLRHGRTPCRWERRAAPPVCRRRRRAIGFLDFSLAALARRSQRVGLGLSWKGLACPFRYIDSCVHYSAYR
jgi:hypothetical protein